MNLLGMSRVISRQMGSLSVFYQIPKGSLYSKQVFPLQLRAVQ